MLKTPHKPPPFILPPSSSLSSPRSLHSSASSSPKNADYSIPSTHHSSSNPPPCFIAHLPPSSFPIPSFSSFNDSAPHLSSNSPPSDFPRSLIFPLSGPSLAQCTSSTFSKNRPPPEIPPFSQFFYPAPSSAKAPSQLSSDTQDKMQEMTNNPKRLLEEINILKNSFERNKKENLNPTISRLYDFLDKFGLITMFLISDRQFIKNLEELSSSSCSSSPSSSSSFSFMPFLQLLYSKFSFEGELPSFLQRFSDKKMANLTDRNIFNRLWSNRSEILKSKGNPCSILHHNPSLLPFSSLSFDNMFNRMRAWMDRLVEKLVLKHAKKKENEAILFFFEAFVKLEFPENLVQNPLQALLFKKLYELKNMYIKEIKRRIPKIEELGKNLTLNSSDIGPSNLAPATTLGTNIPTISSFPIDEKVYKILHKHNNLIVHQFFNELDEKKRKINIKDTNLQEEILGIKEGCEIFEFNNLSECLNKLKGMENCKRQPLKIIVKFLFSNHSLITNQDSIMKIREKGKMESNEIFSNSKLNDSYMNEITKNKINDSQNGNKSKEFGLNNNIIVSSIDQLPKRREKLNDKMTANSMDYISNLSANSKRDKNAAITIKNDTHSNFRLNPNNLTISSIDTIVKPPFQNFKFENINDKKTSETSFENLTRLPMKNRDTSYKDLVINDLQSSVPLNGQNLLNRSMNSSSFNEGGIQVSNMVSNETLKAFSNTQIMYHNSNVHLNSNMKINNSFRLSSNVHTLSTSYNVSSTELQFDQGDKLLDTPLNEWIKKNMKDEGQKKTIIKIKRRIDPHQNNELSIFNKEIENLINELISQGVAPLSIFNFDGKVLLKFKNEEERKKAFRVISDIPKERFGRKRTTLRCYSGKFKIKEY